jgi:Ca2+-binding EF-hand superfamily protein
LFKTIDSDGSGSLSLTELVLHLKSITDDISEENIERIFEGIDASGDKVVDFEEFKVVQNELNY